MLNIGLIFKGSIFFNQDNVDQIDGLELWEQLYHEEMQTPNENALQQQEITKQEDGQNNLQMQQTPNCNQNNNINPDEIECLNNSIDNSECRQIAIKNMKEWFKKSHDLLLVESSDIKFLDKNLIKINIFKTFFENSLDNKILYNILTQCNNLKNNKLSNFEKEETKTRLLVDIFKMKECAVLYYDNLSIVCTVNHILKYVDEQGLDNDFFIALALKAFQDKHINFTAIQNQYLFNIKELIKSMNNCLDNISNKYISEYTFTVEKMGNHIEEIITKIYTKFLEIGNIIEISLKFQNSKTNFNNYLGIIYNNIEQIIKELKIIYNKNQELRDYQKTDTFKTYLLNVLYINNNQNPNIQLQDNKNQKNLQYAKQQNAEQNQNIQLQKPLESQIKYNQIIEEEKENPYQKKQNNNMVYNNQNKEKHTDNGNYILQKFCCNKIKNTVMLVLQNIICFFNTRYKNDNLQQLDKKQKIEIWEVESLLKKMQNKNNFFRIEVKSIQKPLSTLFRTVLCIQLDYKNKEKTKSEILKDLKYKFEQKKQQRQEAIKQILQSIDQIYQEEEQYSFVLIPVIYNFLTILKIMEQNIDNMIQFQMHEELGESELLDLSEIIKYEKNAFKQIYTNIHDLFEYIYEKKHIKPTTQSILEIFNGYKDAIEKFINLSKRTLSANQASIISFGNKFDPIFQNIHYIVLNILYFKQIVEKLIDRIPIYIDKVKLIYSKDEKKMQNLDCFLKSFSREMQSFLIDFLDNNKELTLMNIYIDQFKLYEILVENKRSFANKQIIDINQGSEFNDDLENKDIFEIPEFNQDEQFKNDNNKFIDKKQFNQNAYQKQQFNNKKFNNNSMKQFNQNAYQKQQFYDDFDDRNDDFQQNRNQQFNSNKFNNNSMKQFNQKQQFFGDYNNRNDDFQQNRNQQLNSNKFSNNNMKQFNQNSCQKQSFNDSYNNQESNSFQSKSQHKFADEFLYCDYNIESENDLLESYETYQKPQFKNQPSKKFYTIQQDQKYNNTDKLSNNKNQEEENKNNINCISNNSFQDNQNQIFDNKKNKMKKPYSGWFDEKKPQESQKIKEKKESIQQQNIFNNFSQSESDN